MGITVYHLRVLETGYRTLSHAKELVAKEAIAKYLGIDSSQVSIPTVIPDDLEKSLWGKRLLKSHASQKINIKEHLLDDQYEFNKKVDEMSGQEVRELVKRTYAQNLRYEEENNKLKATIAEIQTKNSEETNYKQRFEELQESTKGIARVAELTKELFVELSVGSF